ncbi:hypothetical protein K437DRAFT_253657 [Tilletiaria anomala UBC 951]|uniref:PhoD-like phosphatase domain-containing protein n=1 Tax=Tilletiaria anomala (strain ATCC 24038 / CBS 436.72 / UBC 951) TaxID=1037660 RepID=A0A066WGA8_TILAU|nr:uncharacterized protein K437DRAFT_253657 [Tilletiaria anomala UBC 951]KDN53007.1 hypothetical protein K437DRAFT_253657 [Tilletiaria anomala UBC 951]
MSQIKGSDTCGAPPAAHIQAAATANGYSEPVAAPPLQAALLAIDPLPAPADASAGSDPTAPAAGHDVTSTGQIQVKAGPMLKYDTTVDGVYHAFAMIVTDDAASDYSSLPTLALSAPTLSGSKMVVQGKEIWHYKGQGGPHTFWRFEYNIPLADGLIETPVTYQISPGKVQAKNDQKPDSVDATKEYTFIVPGKEMNFRWAGHSCNGFSSSINAEEWNGANPLWDDLLKHHEQQRFHMLNGGGDQIYCDKLTKEPELYAWTTCKNPQQRSKMPMTPEIDAGIERFFFTWYCEWFGSGSFSKAIAQIPMMNMLDDHDLIDGFGTYDDDWMLSDIFNAIGAKGYFYYLLFQQFIVDEVDGLSESSHPNKSIIFGEHSGPYLKNIRNHSFLSYLGPSQWILMVDCRSERKIDQIVSRATYNKVLKRVHTLPHGVEHLIILLGVPLAYPRMVFLEKTLASSFNPLILLAKGISPSFTNNFNGQAELLDDLGDHWCAGPHKHERNWLVERIQEVACEKRLRVSFISGDVHAAGVGVFFGYHQHNPSTDPKYMLAVITSAIVNAPPPLAVINMLNRLARKKHRSLFYRGTKEAMVPLFDKDVNGNNQNNKFIMGNRNWCAVSYDPSSSELEFDIRVEQGKGRGVTKSYAVRSPPPRWEAKREHLSMLHMKDFESRIHHVKEGFKSNKSDKAHDVPSPGAAAT